MCASIPHRPQPNMKGRQVPKPQTPMLYGEVMQRVSAMLDKWRGKKPVAVLVSYDAYCTLVRMGVETVRGLTVWYSFSVPDDGVFLVGK